MVVVPVGRGLEEIGRRECMDLLATERVGRLAVVVRGRPEIFPVNYALDEVGAVVIETGPGLKAAAAFFGPVAFEVDRVVSTGRNSGVGWSVVVHGAAHRTDPGSLRFTGSHAASGLDGRSQAIRIQPTTVTGRRLGGPRPA